MGRDIVSRAVGHPATAKPQLKSWEAVHPQAIYRELCYSYCHSYSAGRSCDLSPKAGKLDAPSEAALFPQPPRPGWCTASELLPPRVPGCYISGQNTPGVDPWKLAESSPHHGGSIWQLPSKSPSIPASLAPVVGIDEGRKGDQPRAQRPVAQV